jgi:hypothetical protein
LSDYGELLQPHLFSLKLAYYMGWKFRYQKENEWKWEGNELLRAKAVINNLIIDKVKMFKCLGNMIFSHGNMDLKYKINSFKEINEWIRTNFRGNMSKEFQLRLHKIRAIPALLFASEM